MPDDFYDDNAPTEPLPAFDAPTQPVNPERISVRLEEWYNRWNLRFSMWLGKQDMSEEYEDILQLVPDLVQIVVQLIKEPNLSTEIRAELAAAAEYIINPGDLLPEAEHGVVGLLDDAVIVMTPLKKIAEIDASHIRAHWTGANDPIALLNRITQHQNAILEYVKKKRDE